MMLQPENTNKNNKLVNIDDQFIYGLYLLRFFNLTILQKRTLKKLSQKYGNSIKCSSSSNMI